MSPAVLEEPTAAPAKTKLTLPLPTLQHALSTVTMAVERKTSIPVLGSVKIEEGDSVVDFTGSNLELSARFRVAMPGTKPSQAFLLPALKLEQFAKLLQGDAVKIARHDDRRATLQCGRSTTRLPLQAAANYPTTVFAAGDLTLDQAVMGRLLHFTSFAVSSEESRYTLNGALLVIEDGKLSLVATDGHRLARYTVPTDQTDRFSKLLPLSFLRAIEKVSNDAGSLTLGGDDLNLYANMAGEGYEIALANRKLTGQFPNYKAVIPATTAVTLTVDAEAMLQVLRRCATFTDPRSGAVTLSIGKDEICLRAASTDTGETDEIVDVTSTVEFDTFKIGFCVDYLIDALSRLKGEVEMRFSKLDGQNSMVIAANPEEGEEFTYVLMPMRV